MGNVSDKKKKLSCVEFRVAKVNMEKGINNLTLTQYTNK